MYYGLCCEQELTSTRSRQMSMYSIPTPPPELRHHLNNETFTKAQLYGRDKMTFNIRQMMFNYALSFCMIKFGVFKFAWDATARLMDSLGLAQDRVVRSPAPPDLC